LLYRPRDLRELVVDLLGVTASEYTASEMTYDLRRLRLKGLIFRPPKTNRYFLTPYGWKVARLFSRLEARVFRPAMAMFTGNDAVLPFPLRASLNRVDTQLDELIYDAFPHVKASWITNLVSFFKMWLRLDSVSTLNATTGAITANAAIVPAGVIGVKYFFVRIDSPDLLPVKGRCLTKMLPVNDGVADEEAIEPGDTQRVDW
jgi:hypothetical protein